MIPFKIFGLCDGMKAIMDLFLASDNAVWSLIICTWNVASPNEVCCSASYTSDFEDFVWLKEYKIFKLLYWLHVEMVVFCIC